MKLAAFGWNDRRQQQFDAVAVAGAIPGRVVGEHRTHFQVMTEQGELQAVATGRLRNAQRQRSDLPGVGDFVVLRPATGDGPAVIDSTLPRTSALIRKAAGERRPQLLAANVDVVLIVMALDGDFNLRRLERYLALVQEGGAMPVVVANKVDLATDLERQLAEIAATAPYTPIHAMTARTPADLAQLEVYFGGNQTVGVIGSSGVGKSTITNCLLGREAQATQEVRDHDSRGRHTTTHRQLFLRPHGGLIMDTPGMRELEVWTTETSAEPDYADIDALALACRFRDCRHGTEPSCAVRAAVESGVIDAARVAAFIAHATTARQPKW
jgi:ribosome biogenesis GTPase / thiamine phosphate phosphatase